MTSLFGDISSRLEALKRHIWPVKADLAFPQRSRLRIEQDYNDRYRDQWIRSTLRRDLSRLEIRCPPAYNVKQFGDFADTDNGSIFVPMLTQPTDRVLLRAKDQQISENSLAGARELSYGHTSSARPEDSECLGTIELRGSDTHALALYSLQPLRGQLICGNVVTDYSARAHVLTLFEACGPSEPASCELLSIALQEVDAQICKALAALDSPRDPLQVRAALKLAMDVRWYESAITLLAEQSEFPTSMADARYCEAPAVVSALAAVVFYDTLYVANLGTCRALICNPGVSRRLSVDHRIDEMSEAKRKVNCPQPLAEAFLSRALTVPSSVVNGEADAGVCRRRAQVSAVPMNEIWGTTLVIASRSVTNALTDAAITNAIFAAPETMPARAVAQCLLEAARARGAESDGAVLVWKVPPPPKLFERGSARFLTRPADAPDRVGGL